MERFTAKLYITFGLVASIACIMYISAFWREISSIAVLSFLLCIAMPTAYTGYSNLKVFEKENFGKHGEKSTKEREAATILSLIPGLGHAYLNRVKRGIIFWIAFVIGVILVVIAVMGYTNIMEYINMSPEESTVFLIFGMIVGSFSIFWSALDVNELCIQYNLPHTDGEFDTTWERTDLGEAILFIVTSILMISLAILFKVYEWITSMGMFWTIIIISIILLIYIFVKYIVKKKDNRWY